MATKRKPRRWMVDDPDAPGSVGLGDLLVRLPSGDKVSVRSVFWAALHIAREERGMPLDIEQTEGEVAAWLENEFGSALEFFHWFTLQGRPRKASPFGARAGSAALIAVFARAEKEKPRSCPQG